MRAAEPRAQDKLWQSSTRYQSPLNRRLRDRARSLPTGLAKEGRTKRAQRVDKPWGFSEPDFPLGESFGGLSEPGQAEGELASPSRRLQLLALLRLTPGLPLCPARLSHAPASCSLAFGACAPCFFIFLMT